MRELSNAEPESKMKLDSKTLSKLKDEILDIAKESNTDYERKRVTDLANLCGRGDFHGLVKQYLGFVEDVTGSLAIKMHESARIINRFDERYFERTTPFDFTTADDVYWANRMNPKYATAIQDWCLELPELLARVRREAAALFCWNPPDYAGALVELALKLHADGRQDLIGSELIILVDEVRRGRLCTSVIARPPLVAISLPLSPSSYPDFLTDLQAEEYLLQKHRIPISATSLGKLAREEGNEYMRHQERRRFLRTGLDRAVEEGKFRAGF